MFNVIIDKFYKYRPQNNYPVPIANYQSNELDGLLRENYLNLIRIIR